MICVCKWFKSAAITKLSDEMIKKEKPAIDVARE
jgi:hypothetical protein